MSVASIAQVPVSRQSTAGRGEPRAATVARTSAPGRAEHPNALFRRWQRQRDSAARDLLVERFLPLARSLARRYARSSEPFDDLSQVANIGLLNAIDRFDPDRGAPFASFAVPTILGELKRYFRDSCWSVHVARGLQERALRVADAEQELAGRGRAPTVQELAEYVELTDEKVLEALAVVGAYSSVSLDAPPPRGERDPNPWSEALGIVDGGYEAVESILTFGVAFRRLSAVNRQVVRLRLVENLTQRQIAERIGVSQMHISRLLRGALAQLRELSSAQDTHQPS